MVGKEKKLTIYDIARLTNTSPSTVSAALSGAWKKRRIKQATAQKIQKVASDNAYTINRQAQGLRQAQSGLVGLTLPVHDNRFFSSLSQSFEAHARERGLCPVIVSTLRDPQEERRTVETLISYSIDSLFIAGATDPDALSNLCATAKLQHITIDLPGTKVSSVVSNNYLGAEILTKKIVSTMPKLKNADRNKAYFIGGEIKDYATSRRVQAFKDVICEHFGTIEPRQIIPCGYAPDDSKREIAKLCERIGGLPGGIFINSLTAFEGTLGYFLELSRDAFDECTIGLYDYDPFASFLHFPVFMIRQNADALISKGFQLIDANSTDLQHIEIEPDLILPRTIYKSPFRNLG